MRRHSRFSLGNDSTLWLLIKETTVALLISGFLAGNVLCAELEQATPSYSADIRLTNPESRDQDDMCIWIHPTDRVQSTIIVSDKSSNHIFVYDLQGRNLQAISLNKPGNIDIRQNVNLDGRKVDIVAVNQRIDGFKLVIFQVNSETRKLERIDDNCITGPNYGGCLYHRVKSGQLYFVCTSESGSVEQYELQGNEKNGVNATKVRTLMIGKCEGAVADDETASLYISEEKKGVWKFGADPDAASSGTLIAKIGDHGLKGDVEGLALFKRHDGGGYLLVSDQGRNRFVAYKRESPHQYIGEFAVDGAVQTDGIELCSEDLGPEFPGGFFACHTDKAPRPVLLSPWPQIEAKLSGIRLSK